ncbi:MAG: hypothetical protein EA419_09670, partial [Wenzhouxiangella sp.]
MLTLTTALTFNAAAAEPASPDAGEVLARLEALEARQHDLERELAERDARIRELESLRSVDERSTDDQPRLAPVDRPAEVAGQEPALAIAETVSG